MRQLRARSAYSLKDSDNKLTLPGEEWNVIVGIGVDLVDVGRMGRLHERFGERFLRRILAHGELDALPRLPAPYLASRFAAKEAAVKALGTGFAGGITPQQIEVSHDGSGKPQLVLHGEARRRADLLGAATYHISLSHERQCAVALVVLED